jgi:hypothetical protein
MPVPARTRPPPPSPSVVSDASPLLSSFESESQTAVYPGTDRCGTRATDAGATLRACGGLFGGPHSSSRCCSRFSRPGCCILPQRQSLPGSRTPRRCWAMLALHSTSGAATRDFRAEACSGLIRSRAANRLNRDAAILATVLLSHHTPALTSATAFDADAERAPPTTAGR